MSDIQANRQRKLTQRYNQATRSTPDKIKSMRYFTDSVPAKDRPITNFWNQQHKFLGELNDQRLKAGDKTLSDVGLKVGDRTYFLGNDQGGGLLTNRGDHPYAQPVYWDARGSRLSLEDTGVPYVYAGEDAVVLNGRPYPVVDETRTRMMSGLKPNDILYLDPYKNEINNIPTGLPLYRSDAGEYSLQGNTPARFDPSELDKPIEPEPITTSVAGVTSYDVNVSSGPRTINIGPTNGQMKFFGLWDKAGNDVPSGFLSQLMLRVPDLGKFVTNVFSTLQEWNYARGMAQTYSEEYKNYYADPTNFAKAEYVNPALIPLQPKTQDDIDKAIRRVESPKFTDVFQKKELLPVYSGTLDLVEDENLRESVDSGTVQWMTPFEYNARSRWAAADIVKSMMGRESLEDIADRYGYKETAEGAEARQRAEQIVFTPDPMTGMNIGGAAGLGFEFNLGAANERFQFVANKSDELFNKALETGNVDTMLEAINLQRYVYRSIVPFDPYFNYSNIADPQREKDMLTAMAQIQMQVGRKLTYDEIWQVKNHFADPWKELAGDMVIDASDLLMGPAGAVLGTVFKFGMKGVSKVARKIPFVVRAMDVLTTASARSASMKVASSAADIFEATAKEAIKAAPNDPVRQFDLFREGLVRLGELGDVPTAEALRKLGESIGDYTGRTQINLMRLSRSLSGELEGVGVRNWGDLSDAVMKRFSAEEIARLTNKYTSNGRWAEEIRKFEAGGMNNAAAVVAANDSMRKLIKDEAERLASNPKKVLLGMAEEIQGAYSKSIRPPKTNLTWALNAYDWMLSKWSSVVLKYRPAWVFRNWSDNLFRGIVFGGNWWDAVDLFDKKMIDELMDVGALPISTVESFARSELLTKNETIAQKILNDKVNNLWDLFKVVKNETAENYGERLGKAGAMPGFLQRLFVSSGLRVKQGLDTFSNFISDFNSAVEFMSKARMLRDQYYLNMRIINEHGVALISQRLAESGVSGPVADYIRKVYSNGHMSPTQLRQALASLKLGDDIPIYATMPEALDQMLDTLPEAVRVKFVQDVDSRYREMVNQVASQGRKATERDVAKFFEDIRDDMEEKFQDAMNAVPDTRGQNAAGDVATNVDEAAQAGVSPNPAPVTGIFSAEQVGYDIALRRIRFPNDPKKLMGAYRDAVRIADVVEGGVMAGAKKYEVSLVGDKVTVTFSSDITNLPAREIRRQLKEATIEVVNLRYGNDLATPFAGRKFADDLRLFISDPAALKAQSETAFRWLVQKMTDDSDAAMIFGSLYSQRYLKYLDMPDIENYLEKEIADAIRLSNKTMDQEELRAFREVLQSRPQFYATAGSREAAASLQLAEAANAYGPRSPQVGMVNEIREDLSHFRSSFDNFLHSVWPAPLKTSGPVRSNAWERFFKIKAAYYDRLSDVMDGMTAKLSTMTADDIERGLGMSLDEILRGAGIRIEYKADGSINSIHLSSDIVGFKGGRTLRKDLVDPFIRAFTNDGVSNNKMIQALFTEGKYSRRFRYLNDFNSYEDLAAKVNMNFQTSIDRMKSRNKIRDSLYEVYDLVKAKKEDLTREQWQEVADSAMIVFEALARPYAELYGKPIHAFWDDFLSDIKILDTVPQSMLDGGAWVEQAISKQTFYLRSFQAANQLPQTMPADQLMKWLSDPKRGVKKAELEEFGIASWLRSRGTEKVTRDELVDFINEQSVIFMPTYARKGAGSQVNWRLDPTHMGEDRYYSIGDVIPGSSVWIRDSNRDGVTLMEDHNILYRASSVDDAKRYASQLGGTAPTNWSQYVLPGGSDYRETLLKSQPTVAFDYFRRDALAEEYQTIRKQIGDLVEKEPNVVSAKSEMDRLYKLMDEAQDEMTLNEADRAYRKARREYETQSTLALSFDDSPERRALSSRLVEVSNQLDDLSNLQTMPKFTYDSHWSGDENFFAHARANIHDGEGADRIYHVEEIQSDLHQARLKRKRAERDLKVLADKRSELYLTIRDEFNAWLEKSGVILYPDPDEPTTRYMIHLPNSILAPYSINAPIDRPWEGLAGIGSIEYGSDLSGLLDQKVKMVDMFGFKRELPIRDWGKQFSLDKIRLEYTINRFTENKFPAFPYENNWHVIAFKHELSQAINEGAGYITWTTGRQQFERWGSIEVMWKAAKSYPVSSLQVVDQPYGKANVLVKGLGDWVRGSDGLPIQFASPQDAQDFINGLDVYQPGGWDVWLTSKGSNDSGEFYTVRNREDISKLPGEAGTEWADDIWKQINDIPAGGSYAPILHGMTGFYDEKLPQDVVEYLRKMGFKDVKVEDVRIKTGDYESLGREIYNTETGEVIHKAASPEDAARWVEDHLSELGDTRKLAARPIVDVQYATVHGIKITPEMREAFLQGQPLYQIDRHISKHGLNVVRRRMSDPDFVAKIAGSKAVDVAGNPIMLFHGSDAVFEQFELEKLDPRSRSGIGFYFTDNPYVASPYIKPTGVVYPSFLSIKNPMMLDEPMNEATARALGDVLAANGNRDAANAFLDIADQNALGRKTTVRQALESTNIIKEGDTAFSVADWTPLFKEAGFDGTVLYDVGHYVDDVRAGDTVWIAYDPEQIIPAYKTDATIEERALFQADTATEESIGKIVGEYADDASELERDEIIGGVWRKASGRGTGYLSDSQNKVVDQILYQIQRDPVLIQRSIAEGTTDNLKQAGFVDAEGNLLDLSHGAAIKTEMHEDYAIRVLGEEASKYPNPLIAYMQKSGAVRIGTFEQPGNLPLAILALQFETKMTTKQVAGLVDNLYRRGIKKVRLSWEGYAGAGADIVAIEDLERTLKALGRESLRSDMGEFYQRGGSALVNGATQFGADGKAVMYLFKDANADIHTVVHELAHVYRRALSTLGVKDPRFANDLANVLKWTGESSWTVKAEEQFARAFERYLYDGVVPNPNLIEAFARMKSWLREIYGSLQSDSPVNYDLDRKLEDGRTVRQTFDGWFNYGIEDPIKAQATLNDEVVGRLGIVLDPAGTRKIVNGAPVDLTEDETRQVNEIRLKLERDKVRNRTIQQIRGDLGKIADPRLAEAVREELEAMMVFALDHTDGSFKFNLSEIPWGNKVANLLPTNRPAKTLLEAMQNAIAGRKPRTDLERVLRDVAINNMQTEHPNPYILKLLGMEPEVVERAAQVMGSDGTAHLDDLVRARKNRGQLWDAFTQSIWGADRGNDVSLKAKWGQYVENPERFAAYLQDLLSSTELTASTREALELLLWQTKNFDAIHTLLSDNLGKFRRQIGDVVIPLSPSVSTLPDDYQAWFLQNMNRAGDFARMDEFLEAWKNEVIKNVREGKTKIDFSPEELAQLANASDEVARVRQVMTDLAIYGKYEDLDKMVYDVLGFHVDDELTRKVYSVVEEGKRVWKEEALTGKELEQVNLLKSIIDEQKGVLDQVGAIDGAVPRMNKFMIDYSNTTVMDDWARRIIPFWTFTSRSLPFWIEALSEHPEILAGYTKYIMFTKRYQMEREITTTSGEQLPSLEGYVRVPGTEIWVNLSAPFSFRYVIPKSYSYSDEMEGQPMIAQVAGYLYDYANLFGAGLSPMITPIMAISKLPVGAIFPQAGLLPPWWKNSLRMALAKDPNTGWGVIGSAITGTIIGNRVPWFDYNVEFRMLSNALKQMEGKDSAEKMEIAQRVKQAMVDRENNELWNQTMSEVENSEWARQAGGYFTGIYAKEFTDGDIAMRHLIHQVNLLRDSVNNEIGAKFLGLDDDAEARYEAYKNVRYETSEGYINQLYTMLRWTQVPDPENPEEMRTLTGEERRDFIADQITVNEVTRAYVDAKSVANQALQAKLKTVGVGADREVTSKIFEEYYAQVDAINSDPMYASAMREWQMGYKPDSMIYEHFRSLWWRQVNESKPKYDPAVEEYPDYLKRLDEWRGMLPTIAGQMQEGFASLLPEDTKIEGGRTLNNEMLLKKLIGETNAKGLDQYDLDNDHELQALDKAWQALYWDRYWDTVSGLSGYRRQLAERQFLANNPTPTPNELLEWVTKTYRGRFTQDQLLAAIKGTPITSLEERLAPSSAVENKAQKIWDVLAAAGPDKDELQKAYERLGGYWSDVSTWYNVGGNPDAWDKPEKFNEFYDRLMGAAARLGLKEPTGEQLQEWVTAQDQNDGWNQLITERFGDDIMSVMQEYWAGSTAERRAMRKADPRIDQYYDTKDAYAKAYPIWAKYYTEQNTGSGSSSGGSNRYSGGGGGGYSSYRGSYGGGGSGGTDYDYTVPLGYRTSLDAGVVRGRMGSGQYGGSIRFATSVWRVLSSTTIGEVYGDPNKPVSEKARAELMKAAKKFPTAKPTVDSILNRGKPYEQDYPIDLGW